MLNDLFQDDAGGWLQDVALLDRLVAEKLEREAASIRAEGWKWVEVGIDFPYGHTYGLRQIFGEQPELTPEQQIGRDALQGATLEGVEDEAHVGVARAADQFDVEGVERGRPRAGIDLRLDVRHAQGEEGDPLPPAHVGQLASHSHLRQRKNATMPIASPNIPRIVSANPHSLLRPGMNSKFIP